MIKKYSIKNITTIALFTALASIIGIIDKIITNSIIPSMPGIKIGIANVIILSLIYNNKFSEVMIVVILKSIIVGLIYGNLTTFIIGGSASFCSFIVMYVCFKYLKKHISVITISIIGGITHINIQLIMIKVIYKMGIELYSYGLVLIIISTITSFIVGLITSKMIKTNNKFLKI